MDTNTVTYSDYFLSVEFFDGIIRSFSSLTATCKESAIADIEAAYGQKIVHVYQCRTQDRKS